MIVSLRSPMPSRSPNAAGIRRVGIDARPVVGAGDQEVLRLGIGLRERGRRRRSRRGRLGLGRPRRRPVVDGVIGTVRGRSRRDVVGAVVDVVVCRSVSGGLSGPAAFADAAAGDLGGILQVDDVALADDDIPGDQRRGDDEADECRRERTDDGETLGPVLAEGRGPGHQPYSRSRLLRSMLRRARQRSSRRPLHAASSS